MYWNYPPSIDYNINRFQLNCRYFETTKSRSDDFIFNSHTQFVGHAAAALAVGIVVLPIVFN